MGNGYPWDYTPTAPRQPEKPIDPSTEQRLIQDYQALRLDIANVEEVLAVGTGLDDEDQKRLDKAVVLMKTGAKLMKKVLKQRGYRELRPAALRQPAA